MRMLLFAALLPILTLSQSYYEASGQTVAFTLTAGAKACWNTTVVEKAATRPAIGSFHISLCGTGLFVQTGAKGTIRLYDVRGRKATMLTVDHDGLLPLSRGLALLCPRRE